MRQTVELLDAPQMELAAEALSSGRAIRLCVRGSSMLPSLWPGDILTIAHTSFGDVVCGDIVLVRRNVVHRVIRKENFGERVCLITRGDAVSQNDPLVEEGELLGKVTNIERNGRSMVPRREISPILRFFAWTLRHWSQLRSVCLRLHSWRQSSDRGQLRESVHV